jgi:hypothetical protein
MLFNDECGYQSMLDLHQRGFPGLILTLCNESLRETSKQRVARDLFEQRMLDSLLEIPSRRSADSDPDEEADCQQQQQR